MSDVTCPVLRRRREWIAWIIVGWVAAKERKLSYQNGYKYILNNRDSPR